MKRILISALIALSVLIFISVGAAAESKLEIQGIYDGSVLAANQYIDAYGYLDGGIVECEWTFSPDGVARLSSGKKIRLYDISVAVELLITAHHPETGYEASVKVLVVPPCEKIGIAHEKKMVTGEAVFLDRASDVNFLQLETVTTPEGANAGIEWSSSDESVATVDQNGRVTFVNQGESEISVKTVNGRTASVIVRSSFAAKAIDVIAPEEIAIGETTNLFAVITPEEAAHSGVVWTSSKEKVISVTQTGEIFARRAGKAVITATANSGISDRAEIEVYLPVEEVQIRNSISLKAGQTDQLIVRVLPLEAKYRTVTFVSLNPEIATVDKDGNVTGVSPGTVTIIVSASNGVSAHQTMEIKAVKLESVALSDHFATLKVGESTKIDPVFTPENTTQRKFTYTSSDPAVADVDENGVVHALSAGKCDIRIQSERMDIEPLVFRVNVQNEGALPLEGLVIGINPGCQEIKNRAKAYLSPYSSEMDSAVTASNKGVESKTPEYKLTLDIALCLKEELEKLGAQVVLTRTTSDVDIGNIERAEIINEANADLAIHIHMSVSNDRRTEGFTVRAKYSDYESQMIGQIVLENACRVSGAMMRKLSKTNMYMLLNWSETPALLLECGFLTNAAEDIKLNSPVYQQLLAKGIADGLYEYFTGMPVL